MIRRERICRGQDPEADELTLGEAVNEMLMTMSTERGVFISGQTVICVVNRRKKQTAYYKEAGRSEEDEFDFLRLWCFARTLQVLFHLYKGWRTDEDAVRNTVRRAAFGRTVPPVPKTQFTDKYEIIAYCMQWLLGRDIPQLKNGFGGKLPEVCAAFAKEIDKNEPFEDALATLL